MNTTQTILTACFCRALNILLQEDAFCNKKLKLCNNIYCSWKYKKHQLDTYISDYKFHPAPIGNIHNSPKIEIHILNQCTAEGKYYVIKGEELLCAELESLLTNISLQPEYWINKKFGPFPAHWARKITEPPLFYGMQAIIFILDTLSNYRRHNP